MDKVLDKLGIYDLVAVLLSGICALGTTVLSDEMIFHCGLSTYLSPDNTALFLIIGYILGTILQELGSILTKNLLNKDEKLLKAALDPNKNNNIITKVEIDQLNVIVQEELCLTHTPDITTFYNFCKYSGGNSAQADKDQTIAAFSRSLSLHFFVLSTSIILHAIAQSQPLIFISGLTILSIGILFWIRSIRFYKLRYVKIVRQFFYNYTKK